MTLLVELPWPSKNLHPNARCHWAVRARETKSHRRAAYFLATAASRARPTSSWPDRIPIRLLFYPPVTRARDRDGLVSMCKAYLDGAADALGVNDNRFELPRIEIMETVKRGKVSMEIG